MILGLNCFQPRINTAMYLKTALEIIIGSSGRRQESAINAVPGMAGVPACIASGILLLSGHLIKMRAMG